MINNTYIFTFFILLPSSLLAQNADVEASAGSSNATGSITVLVDSDHDGLANSIEDANGNGQVDPGETDPHNADTDGDGLSDGQEHTAGSDPLINQFTAYPDISGLINYGNGVNLAAGLKSVWGFESVIVTPGLNIPDQFRTFPYPSIDIAGNVHSGAAGTGVYGKPAVFPGINNYTHSNLPNFNNWQHNGSKVTFSFWFKSPPITSTSGKVTFFSHQMASATAPFEIFDISYRKVETGTQQRAYIYLDQREVHDGYNLNYRGGSFEIKDANGDSKRLDDNQWHHLVVTINNREFVAYIDGDFSTAKKNLAPSDQLFLNKNKIDTYLGKFGHTGDKDGNFHWFKGAMDQFLIYERTLSAQELNALWNYDTDGDGLSDRIEKELGSDPYYHQSDRDQDGLSNLQELAGSASFDDGITVTNFGATKPDNFDSDGDLFNDFWEAKYFSSNVDPNNSALPAKDDLETPNIIEGDYDSDGLSNYTEMIHGTNPNKDDTDGDGVTDGDEIAKGSSPLIKSDKPLNPEDFYGDENLGPYSPIGDLGVIITPGSSSRSNITAEVGDESPSSSERWELSIGEKNLVSHQFGKLSELTKFNLSPYTYHEIKLKHLATNPAWLNAGNEPDYDYTATVNLVGKSSFLLCDPYSLLQKKRQNVDLNAVQAATAYLVPLDGYSWSESYSGGDAVGPKHRKIALNGRPMADEKPQQEAESDLPAEETYVDAFNLSLHHDHTFTYLPLASSDLVLQASISSSETGFSSRSTLLPAERLDLPFGAGWSSNLCSYIEIVENIGGPANDPLGVNVIDEAGRPQRFGTNNFKDFFPWPSSRVSKKTFLNTLERKGGNFILKKKFGSTLIYKPCKAWFLYSSDRLEGSSTMRKHTYWRLAEVTDRYGVRLQYTYGEPNIPNEVSLIPHRISSPDRPNQFLVINRTADHRRVHSITDSRGNTTEFTYKTDNLNFAPFSSAGQVTIPVPRLDEVKYADKTSTSYSYDGGIEEEIDTSDPVNPRSTLQFHVNLKSVTDKRGFTHSFEYDFDNSKKYWDSKIQGERLAIDIEQLPPETWDCVQDYLDKQYDSINGEWKTMRGLPRIITKVTLPESIGSSTFSRIGELRFGAHVGSLTSVAVPVDPETTVVDALGNKTIYEFTDVSAELVDVDGTDKSISAEWMLYYLTSKIHHGEKDGLPGHLGTETYQFDKAAGLALLHSTDFSGNVTTWEYEDNLLNRPFGLPLNSILMSKWADPTAKIDALGRREEYSYGEHRVMSEINDVRGTVSEYTVDGLGRRTAEKSKEDGTTVLSQSRHDFHNTRFKAFRTKSTTLAYQNLSSQAWEQDLVSTFIPDDRGRLWRTTVDPGGLNLTTENTYDFNNNLTSTIDAKENRTTFEYDKLNRLVKVTFPSAGTRAGEAVTSKETWFDKNGNTAAMIDEQGNYTIYHYDALNRRVKTIRDMDGLGLPTRNADDLVEESNKGSVTGNDLVTEIRFDGVNAATHVIDSNGNVTRTFYDTIRRPIHIFSGLTLAEATSLPSATAAAAASSSKTHTEFHYTDSGLAMPSGTVKANPGASAFDSSSFKPTLAIRHNAVRSATGTVTLKTYASYDALYRPLKSASEYEPGRFTTAETSYGQITAGKESRLTTATDDIGKITRVSTDGLGRTISTTDGFGTPIAATSTTSYSSTGLAWKATDPLDRESETDFDLAGRVVAQWAADPLTGLVNRIPSSGITSGSPVTRTFYDRNSNVIATVNPLGARTEFSYDARNRKVEESLPEIISTEITGGVVSQTGLVRPVIKTKFDAVGNVIAITSARGNTTRSFYDQAYRTTEVISNPKSGNPSSDPSNLNTHDVVAKSIFDKNGNILASIDGNGNITRNRYDSLNRLIATASNPADGQPNAPPAAPRNTDIVVLNSYDDSGNIVKVTDGEGHSTAFRYDGNGRKTRTIWDVGTPVERIEQAQFNGLFQTHKTDPMGRITSYTYDARHRLTDVTYSGATSDNRHFVYDLAGNQLSVTHPNETAQMKVIRDVHHTYDNLNRTLTETSAGVTHSYEYDRANNTLSTTYGNTGRKLISSYDKLNRLSTCLESPSGSQSTHTTTYSYDLDSNITRKQLPSGAETRTTLDAFGRKLTIVNLGNSGTVVSSFDYSQPQNAYPTGYDNIGNLMRSQETYGHASVDNRTVTNTYDQAYRLSTETISTGSANTTVTSYGYDKNNNRLLKSVTINGSAPLTTLYQFGTTNDNYNSNQLKSSAKPGKTTTYSYDNNGNRTTKNIDAVVSQTYNWDHSNRLSGLTDATTGSHTYAYDYRTRRVLRDESQAGGHRTIISFSGGTSVQEYQSGISAPNVEYIRGSDYGGGIGGILYTIREGNRSYNTYNSRGDVVGKTDQTGTITWQSSYEAFGTRTQEQGSSPDRQTANTKEEDPTGLLNEGFRYRDLETGMFISRDPAGFVDGPNVYTYVTQNPWSAFDPLGLEKYHWNEGGWLRSRGDDVAFMTKDVADKATRGNTSMSLSIAAGYFEGTGKFVQGLTNIGNFKGMKDGVVNSGETVGKVALNAKRDGASKADILGTGLLTGIGEVTGVNRIVEGATGYELGTERYLSEVERVERTLSGVSQAAGMAAGTMKMKGPSGGSARGVTATKSVKPFGDDFVKNGKPIKPRQVHSRDAKSLQDQMVLDAAKKNQGSLIKSNLKDPFYKGMDKYSLGSKSNNGVLSEVHYVVDPKTKLMMDFKFKHHATHVNMGKGQ